MRIATINWNAETDETKIKFSDDFKNSIALLQANVLQDIKAQIDEAYEKAVDGIFP